MGTALALALGKTLAAVDGAAEVTLVIGAYVATAGCTVETAEAKVESRSVCSTILCSGSQCTCGREAAEVVTVAVESTGTFKYDCDAVLVGKFEYECTDARV